MRIHICFQRELASPQLPRGDPALPFPSGGAAIRYASSRWQALTRYVDDGQLEIDNNAAVQPELIVFLGHLRQSLSSEPAS